MVCNKAHHLLGTGCRAELAKQWLSGELWVASTFSLVGINNRWHIRCFSSVCLHSGSIKTGFLCITYKYTVLLPLVTTRGTKVGLKAPCTNMLVPARRSVEKLWYTACLQVQPNLLIIPTRFWVLIGWCFGALHTGSFSLVQIPDHIALQCLLVTKQHNLLGFRWSRQWVRHKLQVGVSI